MESDPEKPPQPASPATPATTTTRGQDIVNQLLEFFSTASNEILGACFLGLGAATYLILGRVGLVLIGAVGGVVLHATFESGGTHNDSGEEEIKKRKENGMQIVSRLLDWREKTPKEQNGDGIDSQDIALKLSAGEKLDFADFQPATRNALTSLVDAVIRDYVKWWYDPILPSETSFPFACRQTFTGFLLAISSHLSRKRPADTFLDFLTNATSIFIVFLSELSHALVSSPGSSDLAVPDAVDLYLRENPNSNLATVLDVQQQKKKFQAVAEDIIQTFLDAKAYNCEPVKIFLREVLSGLILEAMVVTCSKPEWINGWIVYLLEDGEPELMNVIDAGMETASVKGAKNSYFKIEPNHGLPSQVADEIKAPASRQRATSKADDAMEEAMLEAKRLTELMALEDAKRSAEHEDNESSGTTTEPNATPTSSQNDLIEASAGLQPLIEEIETPVETSPSQAGTGSVTSFTDFDQILTSDSSSDLHQGTSELRLPGPSPFTLHNANISIFDDAMPGEKSAIRAKPNIDYLVQIEPASSQHPGWMIARKYADFETLHEVLRRISVISGVSTFSHQHSTIPGWKNRTKDGLRTELERYLRDALSYGRLAESEGMKRFLEKDQDPGRMGPSPSKGVLGFPSPAAFETMGKGMLDVLASAPKGAVGGGKVLLDGVTGVFGGQKKGVHPGRPNGPTKSESVTSLNRSQTEPPVNLQTRLSIENSQSPMIASLDVAHAPPLPRRPAPIDSAMQEKQPAISLTNSNQPVKMPSSLEDVPSAYEGASINKPALQSDDIEQLLHLPPPPSEITDDYNLTKGSLQASMSTNDISTFRSSTSTAPSSIRSSSKIDGASIVTDVSDLTPPSPKHVNTTKQAARPLTEQETRVAVELLFAVINELYTLSSAWNIRKALLNAAKTFLLRPGTPNLEAMRVLLQESMIDANTSDEGLATHILKLRENSLPTEAELAAWPPPLNEEEQEKLRIKARKLLIEKGMPQALTGVMGANASREALGRVFDSLQIDKVARGLMFAMMLQGVKAITH
ncbi:MAG: hypothetical protein MMC33_002694 [Icmadophila ericetorum]|nr:hypothetical protein [Icmadophila ericetorum]